jgi:hypothetical protein
LKGRPVTRAAFSFVNFHNLHSDHVIRNLVKASGASSFFNPNRLSLLSIETSG